MENQCLKRTTKTVVRFFALYGRVYWSGMAGEGHGTCVEMMIDDGLCIVV